MRYECMDYNEKHMIYKAKFDRVSFAVPAPPVSAPSHMEQPRDRGALGTGELQKQLKNRFIKLAEANLIEFILIHRYHVNFH